MSEMVSTITKHRGKRVGKLVQQAREAGAPWEDILAILLKFVGPSLLAALQKLIDSLTK